MCVIFAPVFDMNSSRFKWLEVPSPGVPNLTLSPDEKVVYVMALDQLDKSPYRGKVYSIVTH